MTALLETTNPTRSLATLRRRLALRRAEWLERRATTGPWLLRLPFRIELALETCGAVAWPAHRRRAQATRLRSALGWFVSAVVSLTLAGPRAATVLLSCAAGHAVATAPSGARRRRRRRHPPSAAPCRWARACGSGTPTRPTAVTRGRSRPGPRRPG